MKDCAGSGYKRFPISDTIIFNTLEELEEALTLGLTLNSYRNDNTNYVNMEYPVVCHDSDKCLYSANSNAIAVGMMVAVAEEWKNVKYKYELKLGDLVTKYPNAGVPFEFVGLDYFGRITCWDSYYKSIEVHKKVYKHEST